DKWWRWSTWKSLSGSFLNATRRSPRHGRNRCGRSRLFFCSCWAALWPSGESVGGKECREIELGTTNIQQPTSNIQRGWWMSNHWLFDVGCWMLDVFPFDNSFPQFVPRPDQRAAHARLGRRRGGRARIWRTIFRVGRFVAAGGGE